MRRERVVEFVGDHNYRYSHNIAQHLSKVLRECTLNRVTFWERSRETVKNDMCIVNLGSLGRLDAASGV